MPPFFEVGKSKSDWLDQRSGRTRDGGGGGTRRPARARRNDHRGDRGQHRTWTRSGRGGERLPHNSRYTGQDVGGKDRARPRSRRRSPADALRREAGPSGILSGCGGAASQRNSRGILRESVRQSGQSAGARAFYRARDLGANAARRGYDRGWGWFRRNPNGTWTVF